jgi:hypothetical protein
MSARDEETMSAARRQIARCEALLRKAVTARGQAEWELIGGAIGAAATAGAWLDQALGGDDR